MTKLMSAHVIALLAAGALAAQANAQGTRDTSTPVAEVVQNCAGSGVRIIGDVACVRTILTPAVADQIEMIEGSISAIVLDTPGGDVAASQRIGRRLFRDKTRIIIDGECSSSCANYLAPIGHRKLHVTPGSFIALHGTPPRDLWSFIDAKRVEAGKTVDEMVANSDLFFGWQREYPEHVRTVVLPEVQYFADVNVDEAYATRFAEVMRTLTMRTGYNCAPTGPTLLIIGPDWMRQFRVNSQNVSWNRDRRAFIDALPTSVRDQVLVIDGDEHPSWIPGRGHVSAADCLAAPADAS